MKTKLILLALILLPSSSLLLAGPIEDIQAIQAKSRNPVVLLIDPQQKYEKPGDVEKIKNIAELIEYAGINNIRTIVIAMGPSPLINEVNMALTKYQYNFYNKKNISAFLGKLNCPEGKCEINLHNLINPEEDDLVIAGASDHCCVMQTTEDALERRFNVYINREDLSDTIDGEWQMLADTYEPQLHINNHEPSQPCTL